MRKVQVDGHLMKSELLPILGKFLGSADAGQFDCLADCFSEQTLSAGEKLYTTGDEADRIYFILKGKVAVHHPSGFGDKTQVVAILSDGSVVGESALCNLKARKAVVVAAEETRLAYALVKDLKGLTEKDPALILKLITRLLEIISVRLRKSSERLALAL